MFRKFSLISVLLSFFFISGCTPTTTASSWIATGLAPIGQFYHALKSNSNIIDGFAMVFFFIGMYLIMFNLTRFAFKGKGATPARRGASMILSIMITGAMVKAVGSVSFVGYYGSLIILIILTFLWIGASIIAVMRTWRATGSIPLTILVFILVMILFDLIFLDFGIRLMMTSMGMVPTVGGVNAMIAVMLTQLKNFFAVLIPILIFIGLIAGLVYLVTKKSDSEEVDEEGSSINWFGSPKKKSKEDEEREGRLNNLKDVYRAISQDFKRVEDSYNEAGLVLKELFEEIQRNRRGRN